MVYRDWELISMDQGPLKAVELKKKQKNTVATMKGKIGGGLRCRSPVAKVGRAQRKSVITTFTRELGQKTKTRNILA